MIVQEGYLYTRVIREDSVMIPNNQLTDTQQDEKLILTTLTVI